MRLTPYAQKQADDWLDRGNDNLHELAEILGISRGGIGSEVNGHCYRPTKDEDFAAYMIEDFVEDETRFNQLLAGEVQPNTEELAEWRQAEKEAQDATRFYIWKVPFFRESLFVLSVHSKNGFIDRIEGPYHSVDATLPFGEIVYE